jgi:putative transposase
MQLQPETLYHIYNRGNNQRPVFLQERNYNFFIQKAFNELSSHLNFLAYCLMPNHFHFLVYTKGEFEAMKFSNGMRTLLSSYTRAIQKQEHFTGSLFQQNTKYKEVLDNSYAHTCFHYIHQNPLKAKLVLRIEDWPHDSFNEYMGTVKGFCNTELAREILTIPTQPDRFYKESYDVINEQAILELLK